LGRIRFKIYYFIFIYYGISWSLQFNTLIDFTNSSFNYFLQWYFKQLVKPILSKHCSAPIYTTTTFVSSDISYHSHFLRGRGLQLFFDGRSQLQCITSTVPSAYALSIRATTQQKQQKSPNNITLLLCDVRIITRHHGDPMGKLTEYLMIRFIIYTRASGYVRVNKINK
jgi:hypothetical protein